MNAGLIDHAWWGGAIVGVVLAMLRGARRRPRKRPLTAREVVLRRLEGDEYE